MLEIFLFLGVVLTISKAYSCFKENMLTEEEIIAELVEESCFVNRLLDKKLPNNFSEMNGN